MAVTSATQATVLRRRCAVPRRARLVIPVPWWGRSPCAGEDPRSQPEVGRLPELARRHSVFHQSTIFQKESLRLILPSVNSNRSQPRTSMGSPLLRAADRPLRYAAVAGGPMAVVAVVDVGDPVEARLDSSRTCCLPIRRGPRRRPARHVEDTVLGEERHDRVDVVGVERVEERLQRRRRRVRARHGFSDRVRGVRARRRTSRPPAARPRPAAGALKRGAGVVEERVVGLGKVSSS